LLSESSCRSALYGINLTPSRDGAGAISLLTDLLKLDWRKRLNAIDALKHRYFTEYPLPARPEQLPMFEESHELDRRQAKGQKAGLPPAPRGYAVGGEPANVGNRPYANGDNYGGMNRSHQSGAQHHNAGYGGPRNRPPHQNDRRPAWESRVDNRLPPRDYASGGHSWGGGLDGSRSDRPHEYRDRDREHLPSRSRGGGAAGAGAHVDTYIPSYGPESGRREERPRDDRRRWDERDDRRHAPHRDRLDYDDRSRTGHTRSRSRSPLRERERIRDRESLDRDVYRR